MTVTQSRGHEVYLSLPERMLRRGYVLAAAVYLTEARKLSKGSNR